MSSSHVDRNLLFGILSLQMDFISRDALIAAMHAWVLDKQKPLGQILVEQGALAPDAQAILDALVKKHLELHQGNPQQSLAAVGLPGVLQRDLAQFADSDVKASLVQLAAIALPKLSQQTTLPMVTPAAWNARFEILRSHAWGGLGEVYVAQDREVNREVALKRLHERYADDTGSRARFLREAEITGGLEHPGIVPVYGLGTSEDGRPHYAMRFIRGETLKAAIERFHSADARSESERRIELRQLLTRFIAVCNAVEYAHSRGVIHRDLKPSNIMLGKYGETLVVDWGLCKALGSREPEAAADEHTLIPSSGSGSSETLPGSAIGTPAYMSPEQSEGRIDDMAPASDVYSLGATLYTILTGTEPFESTVIGVILGKVQTGDFVPPRERARGVPRALDAVCLKAMSLLPKDRYPSCAALASDIEHWLADEPVAAFKDPPSTRAVRWVRRHRVAAASSAALIAAAFVGLVAGTALLGRANSQIRVAVAEAKKQRDDATKQRGVAESQRQAADAQRTLAEAARRTAEAEKKRAEENFRETRQAIDKYFTLISESRLIDVPGAEPLRKELLNAALEYYQRFPKIESDDAEVQVELAAAYFRMSQIQNVTGAGDWLPTFKKGLEIVERLLASKASVDSFKGLDAGVYDVAGQTLHVDPELILEVRQTLERSIAVWEKLTAKRPKSKGLRNDLAAMYCVLGGLKGDLGLEIQARDRWAKLAAEFDEPRFRAALVVQSANIAQLQMTRRQHAAALATLRDADRFAQRLVRNFPNVPRYRDDAARVNLSTVVAYFVLNDVSRAVDAAQKQISLCEGLVADFPTVPAYRQSLRSNCEMIFHQVWDAFEQMEQLKDFTPAFELYARSQDLIEKQRLRPVALGPYDQLYDFYVNRWNREDPQPGLSFPLPSQHLGSSALNALKRIYQTSPKAARTELLNQISDHAKPGKHAGQKTYQMAEVALRWWAGEREAAVRLLETFAREKPDDSEFRFCLARARAAMDASGKESDPSLERGLADHEARVRIAAALHLWKRYQNPGQVLAALEGCLKDTNAADRIAATKALGTMGPDAKDAVAALRALLSDGVSDVRVAVVEALWKIDRNAMPAPREFRFRVVTRAGQPVVGATVQAWAIRCGHETPETYGEPLGTFEFGGLGGCPLTTTDSQGIVRVTLPVKQADSREPEFRFPDKREDVRLSDVCRELEARGIDEIALHVDHPEHPTWSSFIKVAGEGRIVLSDATTLVIHAHRGNEQATVGHLYPAFSSRSGRAGLVDENGRDYLKDIDWFEKDGALEIHRLDIASQHASRWLRIIHAPEKGPAWFSDLIDLKQFNNNLVSIEISLKPGLRVEGRLTDAVPRPVQNGRIVAKTVAAASEPNPWEWDATTTVAPDGTFVLESLPANENLQIIALCDGWVSVSPTQTEAKTYAAKHRLLGLLHFGANIDSVYPQLYRLEAPIIHPVIAMERTSTCEVTVLDQNGQQIPDVSVSFDPRQMFYNSGLTILGTRFDGLGHVQAQLTSEDHSERLDVQYDHFHATTNEGGVAIVSNLPISGVTGSARPRESKCRVYRQGYKLAFGNVKLLPGQTARVTVRIERMKRD